MTVRIRVRMYTDNLLERFWRLHKSYNKKIDIVFFSNERCSNCAGCENTLVLANRCNYTHLPTLPCDYTSNIFSDCSSSPKWSKINYWSFKSKTAEHVRL